MFIIGQMLRGIMASKYTAYVIVGVLLLAGMYFSGCNLYYRGVEAGKTATTQRYEEWIRKATEEQHYREMLLRHQVNDLREQKEKELVQLQDKFLKEKEEAKREMDAIIESYRNESERLLIEVDSSRFRAAEAAAACHTSRVKQVYRAPLSERAARFLIRQASEADQMIRELNLCKSTLFQTYKTVDDYNALIEVNNQQQKKK